MVERSAQAAILSSNNENAQASGLTTAAAALSERTKQVWSHVSGRGFDVQTCLAALEALACGLAFLMSGSLRWLSEKWKNATSSPWLALLCAGASFAALLVLTGAFAGMALTKQPVRMDITEGPRIGAITPREQPQLIDRNCDYDPIALIIELTSHPEATSAESAWLPTKPQEVERKDSAPAAVPLRLPRILLDARSFATVPLSDRPTNGYLD